jgi:pyruvate carboxylase subunit A
VKSHVEARKTKNKPKIVIKTCQLMGITTVAIYSKADENTPHVSMAEESVYIGESESSKSYLNADKIIKIAKDLKCDGKKKKFYTPR